MCSSYHSRTSTPWQTPCFPPHPSPPSPLLPPVHRPRIKPALALLPKFIKTLNCGAWAGLAFISVAAVPPTSKGALRSQARAGLAFVSHSQKESSTVISFWIPSPFSLLSQPSPAFDPHQRRLFQSTACSSLPLSSLLSLSIILSSTNSPPPPLPAGIILNFAFDDGATIKLPDPSTSQGGLSRIDAQPRRPAAHNTVLGYGHIISSRLSCRCQSRQ